MEFDGFSRMVRLSMTNVHYRSRFLHLTHEYSAGQFFLFRFAVFASSFRRDLTFFCIFSSVC